VRVLCSATLADGSTVKADDAYLKKSIREPAAQIVKGFPPIMPKTDMTEDELEALLAYMKSLSPAPPAAAEQKTK